MGRMKTGVIKLTKYKINVNQVGPAMSSYIEGNPGNLTLLRTGFRKNYRIGFSDVAHAFACAKIVWKKVYFRSLEIFFSFRK